MEKDAFGAVRDALIGAEDGGLRCAGYITRKAENGNGSSDCRCDPGGDTAQFRPGIHPQRSKRTVMRAPADQCDLPDSANRPGWKGGLGECRPTSSVPQWR